MCTAFNVSHVQDLTTVTAINNHERGIIWDVTLNLNEPGGAFDYTVFGEATDAHDGPPADAYDVVKPPAPIPPYLRSWFNDNLPPPYDNLWKDYRHYPGTAKVWNLTVQWVPSDYTSPTTITISWDPTKVDDSEYALVTLCTDLGTPLKNMLLYNNYTFTCPANIPQPYKIICLANQPPNIPNNPNPANQSTNISINTDLSWAGGDPDGDTVTYDVYFGTTSSPPKIMNNQSALTYDPGMLDYDTTYYWKIVAWDNHSFSTIGPLWQFTTQPNQPPNVPSNPNPPNGATAVDINADLSWTGGDPDSDDTVTYDVYFGLPSSPPKVVNNQSALTYDPGPLAYDTTFYWKIVAWDNHDASTAGPVWHFTTALEPNQPPYIPSNPNPPNGAMNVTITSDLHWTGGDPDSGDTVTYDVYFGTTSPPGILVHNQNATVYDPGTLLYQKTYYWKIVSWDNHYKSATGPIWNFTTEQQPDTTPPIVRLTSPEKGFLYLNFKDFIVLKIHFITTLIIGKIEVTVNATDNQSGIERVKFYIDDTLKAIDTTAPYNWTWSDRGFFFPYYIKVIAFDRSGNQNSTELKVWKIF